MPQTAVFEMRLPADVVAAIHAHQSPTESDGERLRVPLAIGLFAERTIGLAVCTDQEPFDVGVPSLNNVTGVSIAHNV